MARCCADRNGVGLGFRLWYLRVPLPTASAIQEKKKEDWRAALDALNRLSTAAVANIGSLAIAKLQFTNDMKTEVEAMKAASKVVYNAPTADRAEKFVAPRKLSESLQHFYMSLPRCSVMPPPDFGEYSSLSKDMPALTLFVHRAMGMTAELNERIVARNALIAELAREGGTGTGLSDERLIYFSSLAADGGEAICAYVDFALDFWRLVLDQVKAYMTKRAKDEYFWQYMPVPLAVEAMPNKELFPLMRSQLTAFER